MNSTLRAVQDQEGQYGREDWDENLTDWGRSLLQEQAVKIKSEDDDQPFTDYLQPSTSRSHIHQDLVDRAIKEEDDDDAEEEEEEEEEEDPEDEAPTRSRYQVSSLLLGQQSNPSELFMRNKPGVAGLPIKGPNSAESPVYVNPKQYERIMKRRVARARLEEMGRLSRERKVGHDFLFYPFTLHLCHT